MLIFGPLWSWALKFWKISFLASVMDDTVWFQIVVLFGQFFRYSLLFLVFTSIMNFFCFPRKARGYNIIVTLSCKIFLEVINVWLLVLSGRIAGRCLGSFFNKKAYITRRMIVRMMKSNLSDLSWFMVSLSLGKASLKKK